MRNDDNLINELRDLPVPGPTADFEQRVFNAANERIGSPNWLRRLGVGASAAAAILAAVLVTVQVDRAGSPATLADAAKVRSVDVLLTSAYAMEGASLTVELDDNLALDNFPDVRVLSWETSLKPGNNKLTLPIRHLDGHSGDILVTLRHGDLHRQLAIHINDV